MTQRVITPWGEVTVLTPEEYEAQSAARRANPKYERQDDGSYRCRDCGEEIRAVTVAHPIWDGPFATSGSGRCHQETVPYCPLCEEQPSTRGEPVAPTGSYHNRNADGSMTVHSKLLGQTLHIPPS